MLAKGHIIAGLATYTGGTLLMITKVPSYTLSVSMIGAGLAGTILGSLLPDIDSPKSSIGQLVPIVSHVISGIFGHRTVTHNLFFSLFWFVLAHNTGAHGLWALAWGVFIHILLDSLSLQGVPWLYPFIKQKIKIVGPFGYRVGKRNRKRFELNGLFLLILLGAGVLIYMRFF